MQKEQLEFYNNIVPISNEENASIAKPLMIAKIFIQFHPEHLKEASYGDDHREKQHFINY